ncbi:hypothetical protein PIB30_010364 [Stylosanthes scabra]|uniref:Uncharacterized protein n=1 Tax=Stylosanthes scabra TaxID=79078 RepID=A0ABU6W625_9FABA|nr:hypothetical protein [Stylosanthes scabra]
MSCRFSQIVVSVYPNGAPREGPAWTRGVLFFGSGYFHDVASQDSQRSAEDSTKEYEVFGAHTHDPNGVSISCCSARQIMSLQGILTYRRRACPNNVRKPWEDSDRSSDGSVCPDLRRPDRDAWCEYI